MWLDEIKKYIYPFGRTCVWRRKKDPQARGWKCHALGVLFCKRLKQIEERMDGAIYGAVLNNNTLSLTRSLKMGRGNMVMTVAAQRQLNSERFGKKPVWSRPKWNSYGEQFSVICIAPFYNKIVSRCSRNIWQHNCKQKISVPNINLLYLVFNCFKYLLNHAIKCIHVIFYFKFKSSFDDLFLNYNYFYYKY